MKTSIANAIQTRAAESVATGVEALQTQVAELHAKLDALLDALAHDAQTDSDTESKPKLGRPKRVQ
jgi:hypothetical protein